MVIKWALFDFQLERESTKKQLQALNPELVPARLRAVKQHFRRCRNLLDLVVNRHALITGSSRALDFV